MAHGLCSLADGLRGGLAGRLILREPGNDPSHAAEET
jgi:hypothetical protein